MARRINDLFIGADKLNIEGREIKHPALIKLFATINLNKISDDPIGLIGLDLETNADDGTLMLLGFWDGGKYYSYYKKDFISVLFSWVKKADDDKKNIVHWNRLDPFIMYKQFLLHVNDPKLIQLSMEKFSKVSGEWNRKNKSWDITPIVEIKMQGGLYFGIRNVIRSNVQFYFRREGGEKIRTVWAYDVAPMFQNSIEKEGLKYLDYYSKIDKSAHIVDWKRFETDEHYRKNIVLKSNQLDARAVYDLGNIIQGQFKTAFNYYPRTLISQGAIARAGIVAVLKNMHGDDKIKIVEDIKSIGIVNYLDPWQEQYGDDFVKDLLCLFFESYSGGQIESYMYGYSKTAHTSDLTQAYPYHIQNLWDLRGSKITKGNGTPPKIRNSYCVIRGDVDIPLGVDYHPLTIKHPIKNHRETNIRAVGEYRASYILEEREFLISLGAKFKNEEWYNIETTGELSPLATVCRVFTDLRAELSPSGQDYVAKISSASLYGILFEAVNTWIEQDMEVYKAGYRGGEFLNPLYATIITAKTRIQVSQACNIVKSKGGNPILVMTDALFWEGTADMLPPELITPVKTVGYFEPVETVNDLVCLGSGRYGFTNNKGYVQAKRRGLNAVDVYDPQKETEFIQTMTKDITSVDIHDPEGVVKEDFNWLKALKIMKDNNLETIKIKVRTLVSVGLVLNNHKYTYKDLGRLVEEFRDVDVIVGKAKRLYDEDIKDPVLLSQGLIQTDPIHIGFGMAGDGKINDQTLPELRRLLMQKKLISRKEKQKKYSKRAVKNYFSKNGDKIRAYRKQNYDYLKQYGYDSKTRNRMQSWSIEKIQLQLIADDKL